jgi:UDP-N-acetyl-D-mannosaminuronic acid transferase (WecB/TagA/CpsF family)
MESDIRHFRSPAPCRRRFRRLTGNDSCLHIDGIAPNVIWLGLDGLKRANLNLDGIVHGPAERPGTDGVGPAFDLASTKSQAPVWMQQSRVETVGRMIHARMAGTQSG